MKKFVTILMLVATLSGCKAKTAAPTESVKKSRIETLVNNLQREASGRSDSADEDASISLPGLKIVSKGGVEIVSVSKFWVKSAMGIAARSEGDENLKEAASLMKSLTKLMVVSYDGCEESLRNNFSGKISKALKGSELLMEAKDGSETMSIYGVTSKDGKTVKDIVLFAPENNALICFFGSLDTDRLGSFIEKASR